MADDKDPKSQDPKGQDFQGQSPKSSGSQNQDPKGQDPKGQDPKSPFADGQDIRSAKPQIEPDDPTPNRDKRRQPVTLDLKADPAPKPASTTTSPASTINPNAATAAQGAAKPLSPGGSTGSGSTFDGAKRSETIVPATKPTVGKSAASEGSAFTADTRATGGAKEPPGSPASAARAGSEPPVAPRAMGAPLTIAIALLGAAVVAGGVGYGVQALYDSRGAMSALKAQIASLSDRLSAADQKAAAAATPADVGKQVAASEADFGKRLAAESAARAQAGEVAEKRIQKLEAIRNEVTAALEKRVGNLEALTTTLGAQIDQASTKSEVVRVQAARAIEAVAKASATPPGSPIILPPTVDIAPVNEKIKKIDEEIAAMRAAAATPKDATRATEVRAVVASPQTDPANLAIVVQALSSAFDSGRPLGPALASAKALGVEAKLGPLQPYTDAGAPSLAALSRSFDKLKPQMIASVAPPPPTGFLGRLSAGAASMVSVERTDETPKSDDGQSGQASSGAIEARLAKVTAAMASADTGKALGEWEKLPAPARKISQGWADTVKSRAAAAAAIQSLSNDSLAALSKPKS